MATTLKVPNSEATVVVADEEQVKALLKAGFTKAPSKSSQGSAKK